MLLTNTGYALVERLERQTDVSSLLGAFQRLVQSFGMTGFCLGDPTIRKMKSKGQRWEGTWPAAMYQHYASRDYLTTDPLVAQMNRAPQPIRWAQVFARVETQRRQVQNDAKAFGISDGMIVPIHGRKGVVAGVSLGTAHYDLSAQDEGALQIASLYLHARISALRSAASAARPLPERVLTPRERECLKWVAAGKTDWEISQILNISQQTAHGYVQNALNKLNARTRAQAVALAILSSQIDP